MFVRPFHAPFHKGADGRRGGVKDGHAMFGDEPPEAIRLGVVGRALVHQAGRAVGQRAVNDIAVPGDPADISRTPVNILRLQVEDIFGGHFCAEQVAAGAVQNAFGFSS